MIVEITIGAFEKDTWGVKRVSMKVYEIPILRGEGSLIWSGALQMVPPLKIKSVRISRDAKTKDRRSD